MEGIWQDHGAELQVWHAFLPTAEPQGTEGSGLRIPSSASMAKKACVAVRLVLLVRLAPPHLAGKARGELATHT